MAFVRARVMVKGEVQGVFFRSTARQLAVSLGVTGWIRNRPDGDVEGVFEGDDHAVRALVDWCHRGPPAARVEECQVEWLPATGEFSSFTTR